jgi:glycosyltransferase involved in cell wall biosynthesis
MPDERAGVRMLGYIDTAERRDLLAAIDTLALTSRTESFGIVYLEAWVNRKPVIAARAGAVPELVRDGETGLLVPYGNPDALARTIGLLMDDEGLRQSLGEHGRQLSESRYTWPDVLRRVERGYLIATERMPPLPEGAE